MKIVAVEPLGIKEELLAHYRTQMEGLGAQFITYPDRNEEEAILAQRIGDADVVIISNIPLRKSTLKHCPNVKMISVAFTGVDHIDLPYCNERDITVSNCAGYSTIGVSELTICLMIDVLRKVTELHPRTLVGGTREGFLGRELSGKTVGIIGTGAIGCQTAHLLHAFGCKILAYSRSCKEALTSIGVEYTTLDNLLKLSDVVTLHLPLNKETTNIIGKDELVKMKQSAILVNCARGNIVNLAALKTAIEQQQIAGAAFDVFDIEPPLPAGHPLIGLPNVVLTPHIAYATQEAFAIRAELVMENIEAWVNRKPIRVVN